MQRYVHYGSLFLGWVHFSMVLQSIVFSQFLGVLVTDLSVGAPPAAEAPSYVFRFSKRQYVVWTWRARGAKAGEERSWWGIVLALGQPTGARIFKETIGWNHETTNCLAWQLSQPNQNNFQPFSKVLRVKQPVHSTKQHVIFHLVGKTHDFKKVFNHISFRFNKGVDHTLFYPDPTHTKQQHQPFIKHLGFGFFKEHDHSWSTNSPYLMKRNPGCLFWSWLNMKQHLQKKRTMQSTTSLIVGYDSTKTNFLHNRNSRKTILFLPVDSIAFVQRSGSHFILPRSHPNTTTTPTFHQTRWIWILQSIWSLLINTSNLYPFGQNQAREKGIFKNIYGVICKSSFKYKKFESQDSITPFVHKIYVRNFHW